MKFPRRKTRFFIAWALLILGSYFCISDILRSAGKNKTAPGQHEVDDDERPRRFESTVRIASQIQGVDPDLVWAMMKAESNFDPHALSPKGARGLMQLMPGTARRYEITDLHDPAENIHGGVHYLRELLDRFEGNVRLAVAAYNAGPGTVAKYQDIPPYSETRRYVRRVLTYYQRYSGRGEAGLGSALGS